MNASSTGKVYFDLTSALRYILENDNITGIQRVEINIALEMIGYLDNVHICYFDEELKKHLSCPIATITQGERPSKELILSRFGSLESGLFPRRRSLKGLLNKSQQKGIARALLKIKIYFFAILKRKKYYSYFPQTSLKLEEITEFANNDVIYLIGNMISTPELIKSTRELKNKGGIVVQTVHDLIPLTRPELAPKDLSENFTKLIEVMPTYATHLVCVSEYTRKQVSTVFDKNSFESISAIPLAHEFLGVARVRSKKHSNLEYSPLTENFVLCVGTIEIRKNGFNLLQAWKKVMQKLGEKTPKLVFAGKIGWHLESFKELLASDSSLQAAIKIINKPTDEELSELYRNCLFTVFPSQYEGWGLPIGESLWFGKACIASSSSSMPEVGGDLVSYVDPHDIDQIASRILDFLLDESLISAWERKIHSSDLRSWSDVSRDIASFILKLRSND